MKKNQSQAQDAFNFSFLSEKEILELPSLYIKEIKKVYKEIKSIKKEDRTFANTVLPLENSFYHLSDKAGQIFLLLNVHPDKKIRESADKSGVELSQKLVDTLRDVDIFKAVKEYKEGNFKKESKKLDVYDKKIMEELYRDFHRLGFDLSETKQNLLKAKLKELSKQINAFSKNINDYQDFILCSPLELKGLPESYINSLPKIGKFYKVTLSYNHSIPFLSNAENREKRKELYDKNSQKGGKKNLTVLNKMLSLRKEIAKLLGYKNYVDFKVEDRMAKNNKNVLSFIDDLMVKVSPIEKKERLEFYEFAKTIGFLNPENHDTAFIYEKFKKERFDINTEEIKEYFQTEIVLKKMFEFFGDLFFFSVKKIELKTWHESVVVYEVRDKESAELLSYLALDLYPREGKFSHAGAFDTKYVDPKIVTLVCNFGEAGKDTPATLSIREVETIFHEFGHALHFMLSKTKYVSDNGFSVAWDFVETPSQFMENFFWNKDTLKDFSKHFKTGKKLNDNQIEKIIASRYFQEGSATMMQLIHTKLDLDLHLKNIKEANIYYQKLAKKWKGQDVPKTSLFPASFGHLAHYDSAYYSYLWALVYAQDIFSLFEGDIKNKVVGKRYRDTVLTKGASVPEQKIVEDFLQRKVSNKAFLKSLGL